MPATHLFLAPHPDDAVLSCGGYMYQLTSAGQRVEVLTLMAGDAPHPLPASPLVEAVHARWGLGDNPMPARRTEDQRAVGLLGGAVRWHTWLDCIYRTNATEEALYPSDDAIFGDVHPADPLRDARLPLDSTPLPAALYVPLGAGNHVDHQLVRAFALDWLANQAKTVAIFFYEEYPYSSEAGEVLHSHSGQQPRLSGATAINQALTSLPLRVDATPQPLSSAALARKIEAIGCYASQISTFWDSVGAMAARVRENVRQVGQTCGTAWAERLWAVQ